jgi:hypothetical protein
MPNSMRPTLPSSYEPYTAPASTGFDFNSILQNDYDWSDPSKTSGMMDLDDDFAFDNPFSVDSLTDKPSSSDVSAPLSTTQKLEFSAADLPEELVAAAESEANGLSLAGLDISFDAQPEDGKIRVRIHTSPSTAGSTVSTSNNSRASSPGLSSIPESSEELQYPPGTPSLESVPKDTSNLGLMSPALPSPSPSTLCDPFLGIGSSPAEDLDDFSSYFNARSSDSVMLGGEDFGSEYSYPGSISSKDATKKRVRIALKSMPSAGGEGGEWEVQVC